MGLLDSLFGGGTKLDLKLDTNTIPEGGTLSGTLTLSGGKKPLKLTALKVRLVYVKVTPVEGQALPKSRCRNLLATRWFQRGPAAASLNKYDFSFQVRGAPTRRALQGHRRRRHPQRQWTRTRGRPKVIGAPTGEAPGACSDSSRASPQGGRVSNSEADEPRRGRACEPERAAGRRLTTQTRLREHPEPARREDEVRQRWVKQGRSPPGAPVLNTRPSRSTSRRGGGAALPGLSST
jgi:hypothetical protein